MICFKHKYDTPSDAKKALRKVRIRQKKTNVKRRVCKTYPCFRCGGWHLTSHPM